MDDRAYSTVEELLQSIGGSMAYRPGGGPGGVWQLTLRGRTATVSVRDNRVNALDALYVARVANPQTWDDFDQDAGLVPDAFWKLVAIFNA